jgi:tetratricopeptide (TPR) repeat protein
MATIAEAFALAARHHQAGQFAQAEQLYRRILQAAPGHHEAWHLLGVLAQQVGRPDAAVECLGNAVRLRPASPAYHNNLATAYRAAGKPAEALAHYQEAVRLDPAFATAYSNLGAALVEQGRPAEALIPCQQALRLQPDHGETHNTLGAALVEQGRFDEAEFHCRKALRLVPGHALAHNNLGRALQGQGKRDEAIAHYREAIRLRPDVAVAHNNLGTALLEQRRPDEAAPCFREALRLQPTYADAFNNLGGTCLEQGRVDEAVAHCREAVRLAPGHAFAHNNLGHALQKQGHLDEAAGHYREAIRLRPAYAAAHSNLGALLTRQGRADEAVAEFQEALRLDPGYADAHNNLAAVLVDQDRLREAEHHAREAVRLNPNHPPAHNNLGRALQGRGRTDDALAAYREAIRLKPDYYEAYNNAGTLLIELGSHDEAGDALREALRLKPDYAEAHNNLGVVLVEQGRFDEARAHCHEALRLNPDHAMAYATLASLHAQGHYRLSDEELARLKGFAASDRFTAEEASGLHFALAAVLDKEGAADDAFEHYRRANERKALVHRKRERVFDPALRRELVGRVLATCDAAYFRRVAGFGLETELPVFIVGMPRSGTTLVEQILASHPRVHGAGELRELTRIAVDLAGALAPEAGYPECLARLDRDAARAQAERHLGYLQDLGGAAVRVIDKLPDNYLHLGLVAALFPQARVIHCRRDPVDTCLSCYFQNFKDVLYAQDLEHLGLSYRLYERVMAHWRQVLPLRTYEVSYEELVADQEAVSRELVAFLGLEWDERCLAFHENRRVVRTASKLQVRRPMYSSSVRRWKRYEAHLQPLLRALAGETSV